MLNVQVLEKDKIIKGKFADMKKKAIIWADFIEPSAAEIKDVAELVGMDEKEIHELLEPRTRPVLTNIDKYSVIVVQTPAEHEESATMPLLIFITKKSNDLITLHTHKMPSIERMLAWNEKRRVNIFQKGTTFILFRLIDEITSSYSIMLEAVDDNIDLLEEGIYNEEKEHKDMMRNAFDVKKRLIFFYKALTANRDVVSAIEKEYGMFLNKKDLSKFRLLTSDFTQLIELTVTYRDILSTTIEVYLSVVSNNLNITMKKITAWGAIILLPTIITGLYGMNFKHMPEIPWVYGYPFALGLMLVLVFSAYIYFKRKEWL
ncbi:MAG: magnesium transporter CorA family protein [Nanoarchaeota archaeon]|nr:magnesium transporter CorA family protein [Nanoarchaeota archaeon]